MKQLPVLEPGDKPRKETWYNLTPVGDSPCARVGHSCSYLPPVGDAERGKVFIVGGADPNRSFSDVHTIDLATINHWQPQSRNWVKCFLGTHQWDLATSEGLLPRYEHTSFTPSCTPHSIWVFGGADQSGNRNCLQVLNPGGRTSFSSQKNGIYIDLEDNHDDMITHLEPDIPECEVSVKDDAVKVLHSICRKFGKLSSGHRTGKDTRTWTTPEVTGPPPSPRTFHTASAAIGDQLYVFGGGERGAQPVQDVQLHVFDANTLTWSQPKTQGKPPSPRHGHVMVAAGTKLFIHGGLAGDSFYDDLHCIDTSDMKWQKLRPTGAAPTGCAAHSAVAVGKHLYIFGGMTPTGALNTMYQYHIEKQHWTLLKFDNSPPAGRLDHSMCIIPWPGTCTSEKEDSNSATVNCDAEKGDSTEKGVTQGGDSHEESQADILLCFVFGGMNTEGEIYDDCIVTAVD